MLKGTENTVAGEQFVISETNISIIGRMYAIPYFLAK